MKRWHLLFSRVLICGSLALGFSASRAYTQEAKPVKILFLLDGSSSMLDDWQPGVQRFKEASSLINTIIDSIQRVNPNVQFALRVFGHQSTVQQNNCYDTKLEVPFTRGNEEQIKARLQYISPRGVSPIAYSLKQTAEENFLDSDHNAYSIILLTDGGESCGGNICEVIEQLLNGKISFRPYILSLINNYDLQKDYNCFGKFLSVSTPSQIGPAIKTIIDDNRLMFEKNDGQLAQTKQEPIKETPKPVIDSPKRAVVEILPPASNAKINALASNFNGRLSTLPSKKIIASAPKRKALAPISNIKFIPDEPVVAVVEPPKPKPKVEIIGIKKTSIRRIPNIWVFEEVKPYRKPLKVSKVQFIADEPVVIATAPEIKQPTTTTPPKPKTVKPPPATTKPQVDAPVKVYSENSAETKVLVYFTDGKGKYYKTEPKIDFVDVKTGKVVQSNYRLVDRATGIPEGIKIPPGTYRITRAGSSFRSSTFTIPPNTTDRVDVMINKGSIMFRYETNHDRPMIEYYASVQNSVEKGPLFRQRGDELLEYDPGIYHIEINTLPITERTLPDLKFGEVTIIDIPEPGTIAITNSFRGKVQLWCLIGAHFQPFYDFVLTGDPKDQTLNLQPGPYRVYFFKDGKEQEMKFQVKSNETTQLTL